MTICTPSRNSGETTLAQCKANAVSKYVPSIRPEAITAPLKKRASPLFSRCSKKAIDLPNATTG